MASHVVRHSITGTDEGNRIQTGNGADSIWGQGGNDVLDGGGGYDTFALQNNRSGKQADIIRDVQPGFDQIDISAVAPGISLVPHSSGTSGLTEILDGYRNVVGIIEGWAGTGLVVTHDFIL